eukprot:7707039-Pyramimonas_sp.AAC.1
MSGWVLPLTQLVHTVEERSQEQIELVTVAAAVASIACRLPNCVKQTPCGDDRWLEFLDDLADVVGVAELATLVKQVSDSRASYYHSNY